MSRKEQILAFLQDAPMDAFLHYALAQEHIKTGDQDAALGEYLWLTENHPGYVATYYHLGKLLISLGKKEEALAWSVAGAIVVLNMKLLWDFFGA